MKPMVEPTSIIGPIGAATLDPLEGSSVLRRVKKSAIFSLTQYATDGGCKFLKSLSLSIFIAKKRVPTRTPKANIYRQLSGGFLVPIKLKK